MGQACLEELGLDWIWGYGIRWQAPAEPRFGLLGMAITSAANVKIDSAQSSKARR
ncbi:hypothetical protein [Lampropedia aestuarii]|uniref:hypothetical protein n=1 Tax=Lampropedia aestuarii TaxID=2562762 RepID=UPI00246969DC|nr:hypothetical protein [Lampropedia aestuarii]MDH5856665.1 hypothetical protein [Lampropedia aestuarii]